MQRAGIFVFLLAFSTVIMQAQTAQPSDGRLLRLGHSFAPYSASGETQRLPDTVRLIAIMVDFQTDDDSRTSGSGAFGSIYEYDYGTEILDPMPHDRAHFQNHVLFLENYVRKASGRKTYLSGEVLDGVVTVSGRIADYSFRKNETEAPVARFAVEAWEKAVQQFPAVDFSAYHMFVIFHAGRGRDIDLAAIQGFDPTPLDIPSLSFNLTSFRRLLGGDFNGIDAGGGFRITNTAVLPTTNNREISNFDGSRTLLQLTINGLLAASFGSWAGLPDLFNTQTGKTGIGRFGLMDGEGIFAYGGICPPEPSAWEKQQLGWTSPRLASPGTRNYLLVSRDSISTADIIRVPITDTEYWLLENRQRDPGGDGQLITYVVGGQVQQRRFPKDTLGFDNSNVSQLKGVIIDVEDLDWSVPGGRVIVDDKEARVNGGILIWHIDEREIEARRADNAVNVPAPGRAAGVLLEQAGGPQDIGVEMQTIFGPLIGAGSPLDYWTSDNISPVFSNRFDDRSIPNTRANSGAHSQVAMWNFSSSGPVMSVDIALGTSAFSPMEGYPIDISSVLPAGQELIHIRGADLDGDGLDELLLLAHGERVGMSLSVVHQEDGRPFLSSYRAFAQSHDGIRRSGAPAAGDILGDGLKEIVMISNGAAWDEVIILAPVDRDGDGEFDDVYRQRFDHAADGPLLLTRTPQILHGALLLYVRGSVSDSVLVIRNGISVHAIGENVFDGTSSVHALPLDESDMLYFHNREKGVAMSLTGARQTIALTGIVTAPLGDGSMELSGAADMNGDGKRELVLSRVFDETGPEARLLIASYALGQSGDAQPTHLQELLPGIGTNPVRSMAFADIDGNGCSELLLGDDSGNLLALNRVATAADYYPVRAGADIVLTARGEDGVDRVFTAGASRLHQFRRRAARETDYPISFPAATDVVLLRGMNNRLAIAAVTAGEAYLFETAAIVNDRDLLWSARQGDSRNSGQAPLPVRQADGVDEFFPRDRCYNWPNPVYDGLTRIRFFVSEDADVTVKIYDLAGDHVETLYGRATGGMDNEIVWNAGNIQSDVYLARVEAIAPGKKGEKVIKIAIVR
jgi:hypothetical protein